MDFLGCRLVRARCVKPGGDEDAAELAVHVGGGRAGLAVVPGGAGAVLFDVGGVVAGGGVLGLGQGLAGELERMVRRIAFAVRLRAWPAPNSCLASWIATSIAQREA